MNKIDASKCRCYENGKCLWTKRYYENNIVPDCERVKYCYYKQLQQLKQENEELKKQLMQKDEVNTFFNTLDWNNDPCKICPQKNCLDEIEEIIDDVGDDNYLLIREKILVKIDEVKGDV